MKQDLSEQKIFEISYTMFLEILAREGPPDLEERNRDAYVYRWKNIKIFEMCNHYFYQKIKEGE